MDAQPAKRRKVEHQVETSAAAAIRRPTAFVLETDELLREVGLDYGRALEGADDLLHELKEAIESVEPHGPVPIRDAVLELEKKHGVAVPFPEPPPPRDSPYKVSFSRPAQFNIVGSYVSKTMIKSQADRAVDMIIVMPGDILQEKDYLDLRYFYKRSYYLAKIAASLSKGLGSRGVEVSYHQFNGNPLLPVLSVAPAPRRTVAEKDKGQGNTTASSPDYCIRLIPCAPADFFPKQKLVSTASLIRNKSSNSSNSNNANDNQDKKPASAPTPFYNSTLKAESAFVPYLRLLRQADKACASFRDATILGRIWLQQRGFAGSISQGGFGHFEWAALTAILLQTGGRKGQPVLSASLNSTQLFRAVIQYLAETDTLETPYVLGQSREPATLIREAGPVIHDSARNLNIAFKMSPWSAALLRRLATWTHTLLTDSSATDHYAPTFIARVDHPAHLFDMCVSLEFRPGSAEFLSDPRGPRWDFSAKLYHIIRRALGNRARLVHVANQPPLGTNQGSSQWPLSARAPPVASTSVLVGIIFDAAHMGRQVDHGPPAEDKKEATRFRQFWGDKAELRRFKDGSILETLIWDSASPPDLCEEIVRYVVGRHLGADVDLGRLAFYGKSFAPLVPLQPTDSPAFATARQAFEAFERDIRGLDDLPLHVRQLAPVCPELRLSSVRAPPLLAPTSAARPAPMDVVLFFEASGKWPDNLAAIQRTKIAFLLKIGTLLEGVAKADGDITTHLGIEEDDGVGNSTNSNKNLAYLDVVYPSGAAFRLHIHCDLEEPLLETRSKDKTRDRHARAETAALLADLRRRHACLPLHTQTVRTHATRFPALSPAIRLLRAWFDAHKLSVHFPDDLVELFVLHVFLEPYPWDTPSSPATAFLRALLFLARWDWRSEPLVVDTSSPSSSSSSPLGRGDDLAADAADTPVDRAAAATRLEAWRNIDPAMNRTVLVVATNHDLSGTAHTYVAGEPSPVRVVATRMTTLARAACRAVRDAATGPSAGLLDDASARALFAPALADYDFLLRLNRKALRHCSRIYATDGDGDGDETHAERREMTRSSSFKNLDPRTGQAPLPPAGPHHPARTLVLQLRRVYGAAAVFFHGAEDDAVVGAVWNPQAHRRSFRAGLLCSYRPAAADSSGMQGRKESGSESESESVSDGGDDDMVEVNREGILAEIARIGGDLIDKIEVKEDK